MTTPIHGGMPCDPLTVEGDEPASEAPARRRSGLVAASCLLVALALVAALWWAR